MRRWAASAHVSLRQWRFVDDVILQASPADVPMVIAEYERTCRHDGVELVRAK